MNEKLLLAVILIIVSASILDLRSTVRMVVANSTILTVDPQATKTMTATETMAGFC
jgi:hypothetical protein